MSESLDEVLQAPVAGSRPGAFVDSVVCLLLVCLRLKLNCAGCLGRGSGKVEYIMEGFKAHIEKIHIYLRGVWEPLQDPEKGGVYDLSRRETLLCVEMSHPPQLPCKCGLRATRERKAWQKIGDGCFGRLTLDILQICASLQNGQYMGLKPASAPIYTS